MTHVLNPLTVTEWLLHNKTLSAEEQLDALHKRYVGSWIKLSSDNHDFGHATAERMPGLVWWYRLTSIELVPGPVRTIRSPIPTHSTCIRIEVDAVVIQDSRDNYRVTDALTVFDLGNDMILDRMPEVVLDETQAAMLTLMVLGGR